MPQIGSPEGHNFRNRPSRERERGGIVEQISTMYSKPCEILRMEPKQHIKATSPGYGQRRGKYPMMDIQGVGQL
jgi:hypothetical protein